MIKSMSDRFSGYLVRMQAASANDAEVNSYGMEIMLGWLVQAAVLLAGGSVLRLLPLLAVFLPAFAIKKVVGGYHTKGHASCITTFSCLTLGACLVVKIMPLVWQKTLLPGIVLFAVVIIFNKAPVFHVNNPKSERQRLKYRGIARIWGMLQALVLLLLVFVLPESCFVYIFAGALGFALAAGTLLIKSP